MQSGDERRTVDLFRTAGTVAETYDVRATLLQACGNGKAFCMEGEGDEPRFAVTIIPHENGKLPARFQGASSVANELPVPTEEVIEGR
jgi:hypothetical protein